MAATERVRDDIYEYAYNAYGYELRRTFVPAYPDPQTDDGRVQRTRERPKREGAGKEGASQGGQSLTTRELRQLITVAVFVAVLLIGILVLNAYAANIQCNINILTKANMNLENEIDVLNMKIDESSSIEQIESYAMDKLKMQYPKNNQCIYVDEDAQLMENFSQVIRQKAYE